MGWRFVLSRRWAGYLALAVVFAIACVFLSRWQWGRNEETVAALKLVQDNYNSTPVALDTLLPSLTDYPAKREWTPVLMTGKYLLDDQLLVRNRVYNGLPGLEVLTPLLLDDGSVFVVDRGWIQGPNSANAAIDVPAPPSGTVTVTARIQPGEPTLPDRSAPKGQIATIHLPEIARLVGHPTYTGSYGLLDKETPQPVSRPYPALEPVLDQGPYLSYAFQWLAFAVMGFGGLWWAVRNEFRILNADQPEERARAEERARRKALKKRTDSEEEDALLARWSYEQSRQRLRDPSAD